MSDPAPIEGYAALRHLGVIRARGADAKRFLHAQLTHDMTTIGPDRARWAGLCSAKGRLLASFLVVVESDESVLLICAADLLATTMKRLAMFVLRLKCALSDASAEFALQGAVGAAASTRIEGVGPLGVRRDGDDTWVAMEDGGAWPRALVLAPPGGAPRAPAIDASTWRWLDIRAGRPWIESATVDRFVPQMINLELLGAVDFQKGCYPGQEVVARSQYRGTIKRRMFLFDSTAELRGGDEVFASDDPSQPAGLVVNAAPAPGGGWSALVEIKLAALDAERIHTQTGIELRRAALPYVVPLAEAA